MLCCIQPLLLCFLLLADSAFLGSGARSPEDHRSVCRRREEGLLVGVPSTLDHLVPVLPCQRLREGLRQVAWGPKGKKHITHKRRSWFLAVM